MDVVVLKPSLLVIVMAVFLSFSIIQPSSAQDSPRNGSLNNNVTDVGAYPSASPPPSEKSRFSPFKPSIAVIVGVLTTMFSVTLLLLLYAKHCKRGGSFVLGAGDFDHYQVNSLASTGARKNSGIDRGVVESLPVFRFSSLSGHNKEGLECAVCLSRFESAEVLRLLPKCKHAFHVECIDTWLDAHSTCPLCRYRVDPEDVLLIDVQAPPPLPASDVESGRLSLGLLLGRLSGRYSSAGERVFQTVDTASYRRSLDSVVSRKKDSARKDGLLLSRGERNNAMVVSENRGRFEHRIVVSPACGGTHYQRWSDFQPSDLLYLQSEMIMSDCRRFSSASGSRPSVSRQQLQLWRNNGKGQGIYIGTDGDANGDGGGGRIVINSRSVSEITGISRFLNDNNRGSNDTRQRQRQQAGLLSRWLAWVPQLRPTN